MKPGDRVTAILSAEDGTVRLIGDGTYQGMKPSPIGIPNPYIELDEGGHVWGYECWWGAVDKVKKEWLDTADKIEKVDTFQLRERDS